MSLGPTDGSQQWPSGAAPRPSWQPAPAPLVPPQPTWPPPAAAWPPAAPAPSKGRAPGPFAFFVVLLVTVGLVVAGLQALPMGASPLPTSSARPSASGSARPPASTEPSTNSEHPALSDNPLYPLTVGGSCPTVQTPGSLAAYKTQVGGLLDCLAGIFDPLIERAGGVPNKVAHTFYGTRVDTPCGSEADAYAFYCESDRTIYLSEQVYEDSQYARLSVADTVIHEYGHHVQQMAGIFEAAEELDESRTVIVRREELQVLCWTYYVFASVPSFALTDSDRTFFLDLWAHTNDPVGHGTATAQKYWGARGLAGRNLGACNTWSVPNSKVR